jgi:hypothetical protein
MAKPKQYRNRDEVSTVPTEDSSIVESIISTFCCNGSYDSLQSYKDEVRRKKELLRKKKAMQEAAARGVANDNPTIWERLSDLALFFVQGAPPVKYVKCFECSSVDESEVTTPPILREMARHYDESTNSKYRSMSPTDVSHTSTTGGDEINPATSLKPLLLRYARSGIRLKNGVVGGGGGSVSSKSASQKLRVSSDNKQMMKSVNSRSGDARHGGRGGGRSICDRSVATKHSDARRNVAMDLEVSPARRRVLDQRSNPCDKSPISKRSKRSMKFEI